MPNINRLGANVLEAELRNIVDTGIKAVALFSVIDEEKKDSAETEALNQDNFLNVEISKIKDLFLN